MRFCVFSSDPRYEYYQKGEIKAGYWNPEGLPRWVSTNSDGWRDLLRRVAIWEGYDQDFQAMSLIRPAPPC